MCGNSAENILFPVRHVRDLKLIVRSDWRRRLCLAKTSYIHKMNDLAKSSIRTIPVRFSP